MFFLPMISRFLSKIQEEDTFKLFFSSQQFNIHDAIKQLGNNSSVKELEDVVNNFFQDLLKTQDPSSFYYNEALRLFDFSKKIIEEYKEEERKHNKEKEQKRDFDDEIVDLYLESYKYFIKELNEPILEEHLEYLLG